MKQYIGLSILMLGMSGSAFASASYCSTTLASTTACTITNPTTGATYTIDDFTFVGVSLLAGGAASNVAVYAQFDGSGNPEVTLTPNSDFAVSGLAGTETFLMGFDIVSDQSNLNFSGVTLTEQSNLTGLVTTGTVAEEDCYGGLIPGGLTGLQIASLGNGGVACLGGGLAAGASVGLTSGVNTNANVPIPLTGSPTSAVDVLKEVTLTTALGATADVSSVTQDFGIVATPEPGTYFLGGCGLMLIALFRPKKYKSGLEK